MVITTIGLEVGNDSGLNIFDTVTHIGFGTGTTLPTIGNTALVTEIGSRLAVTGTKDDANDSYDFEVRVPLGDYNSSTITEIGLFDASTSGNMFMRELIPDSGYAKTSNDEYVFTLRVKVVSVNGS